HQDPQVAPGVPQLVEQDRHEERHRVADHQREEGELQRVAPGQPEGGVAEDPVVVRPAGPGCHAQAGLLEAHDDFAGDREPREEREAQHGPDQESVRGHVALDLAAQTAAGASWPARDHPPPSRRYWLLARICVTWPDPFPTTRLMSPAWSVSTESI